ncbi:MAG: ferritin-like domain-containing protein, partial [Intestinibacter bartlettii]|uniref:ferritin-like domain-containing protein n=1 Tax=Intestinibacter bartlettii TaxID=261299 RepID=UPI0026F2FED1
MLDLNTKEQGLLKDAKEHETLCIAKYKDHAEKTNCQELKNLFNSLASKEQQHLDTINQILNGTVPNMNQNGGQNQSSVQNTQSEFNLGNLQGQMQINYSETDKLLCQDALSTEKYVSSTYNTSIFEFRDKNIRQVLNHIQKEEQEHGE